MPNESESAEWQEQLSMYAFGLLDGAQAASVERRLTSDPVWQAELRAMQDTLAALADPVAVPVGSAERLLERVRADLAQSQPAQQPAVQAPPVQLQSPQVPFAPDQAAQTDRKSVV